MIQPRSIWFSIDTKTLVLSFLFQRSAAPSVALMDDLWPVQPLLQLPQVLRINYIAFRFSDNMRTTKKHMINFGIHLLILKYWSTVSETCYRFDGAHGWPPTCSTATSTPASTTTSRPRTSSTTRTSALCKTWRRSRARRWHLHLRYSVQEWTWPHSQAFYTGKCSYHIRDVMKLQNSSFSVILWNDIHVTLAIDVCNAGIDLVCGRSLLPSISFLQHKQCLFEKPYVYNKVLL